MEGKITVNSNLDLWSLRCPWDFQVEVSKNELGTWARSSGEQTELRT